MQLRRARGEANQIVHDDVDCAADGVGVNIGEIERFRPDSLAGKCRVAVQDDREHLAASVGALARLLGARAANGHRIHGFQVAGVRHQMNANRGAAGGLILAGRTNMIFHVARAQNTARVHIFKARKHLMEWAAGDVRHHVQPPAVAHGQNALGGPFCAGSLENFVEQRNQRGDAFEGKTLRAQITRLQDLLEQVGADQPLENASAIDGRGVRFETLGNPTAARRVLEVHEVRADRPAINLSRLVGRFAGHDQLRMRLGLQEAERIEIGLEISPAAKGIEDALAVFARYAANLNCATVCHGNSILPQRVWHCSFRNCGTHALDVTVDSAKADFLENRGTLTPFFVSVDDKGL